jgi:hypothetical protein
MIRTSNGGQSWTYDELDIQGNAYDLDFRDDHEAWAPLGPKRKLIYSLDTGVTWTQIPTPDNTAIYDMTFPDSMHGYAIGKDGAVLKFFPPVIPAVQSIQPDQPGFLLFQNSPNPVNDRTTIRFTVPVQAALNGPSPDPIQLKVFNVFGSEVACLVNEPLPPGIHMVTFDTGNLPEGIYFYRLQSWGMVVAGPERLIVLH